MLGYDDGRIGVLNATNGAVPGPLDQGLADRRRTDDRALHRLEHAVLTRTGGAPRVEEIDEQTDVFVAHSGRRCRRNSRPAARDRAVEAMGASTLRIVLAAQQSAAEGREIPSGTGY